MKVGLVPAAGKARRLNIPYPKELLEFRGKAIIEYSIDNLLKVGIHEIVIVIRKGKEILRDYLFYKYANVDVDFKFAYQTGYIGNLIDAVQASYQFISGKQVYFCLADTYVFPSPFIEIQVNTELCLLCFTARDSEWKNFGVVDIVNEKVIDKPDKFISNLCWGSLIWESTFSEKLIKISEMTNAINSTNFSILETISEYQDLGLRNEAYKPVSYLWRRSNERVRRDNVIPEAIAL